VVRIRLNQAVAEALVVALAVVMRHEVLNRCGQRTLAKQDQPFQARFFYAPNELLGVRTVQRREVPARNGANRR
jgi:hypothetical protein